MFVWLPSHSSFTLHGKSTEAKNSTERELVFNRLQVILTEFRKQVNSGQRNHVSLTSFRFFPTCAKFRCAYETKRDLCSPPVFVLPCSNKHCLLHSLVYCFWSIFNGLWIWHIYSKTGKVKHLLESDLTVLILQKMLAKAVHLGLIEIHYKTWIWCRLWAEYWPDR